MKRQSKRTAVPAALRAAVGAALAAPVLLVGACASPGAAAPASGGDVRWDAIVAYEGDAAFERVRAGRPDPSDPNQEIVGVDQAGTVVLVRFAGDATRSEVIYRHGAELTGIAVADVDPSIPGEEIYVGGYSGGIGREGTGGAVVQLVVTPQGVQTRRVYEGAAYVHSMECVARAAAGAPVRLLVTTYAGELKLLTPAAGAGPWPETTIYRDPASADPESVKVKDVALLRDRTGRPPHEALAVLKTGRVIYVDLDRPETARLVHTEEGGLSRVGADPDGGAYMTGYWGRVLHLARDGDGFRVEALAHEGKDSGLRGIMQGRFPVAGGVAPLAIYGFHTLVRTLTPRLGAWDTTTIFRDKDRGHAMECADLVPGNDADEIVVGGYSNRITVLVARP